MYKLGSTADNAMEIINSTMVLLITKQLRRKPMKREREREKEEKERKRRKEGKKERRKEGKKERERESIGGWK